MKLFCVCLIGFLLVCGGIFTPMVINMQYHDLGITENEKMILEEYEIEPLIMPSRAIVPYSEKMSVTVKTIETLVLYYTNLEREKANLPPLIHDKNLTRIAKNHSDDMCEHAYVAHVDSAGKNPTDRAGEIDYPLVKEHDGIIYHGIGENVCNMPLGYIDGYGYIEKYDSDSIARNMVKALMGSQKHRENILKESNTHVGVGVTYGYSNYYLTQDFW